MISIFLNIIHLYLVEILNSKETEDNVLKDYGYDIAKDSYVSKNDNYNLIFGITKFVILLVAFISLIYLFIKHNLKNEETKKRHTMVLFIRNVPKI